MGTPAQLTSLLRNPYAGQVTTVRMDMEKQTGSKLGKEYIKAVYCYAAYSNSTKSISCKMPGCMNHELESRLLGEISTTSVMEIVPL